MEECRNIRCSSDAENVGAAALDLAEVLAEGFFDVLVDVLQKDMESLKAGMKALRHRAWGLELRLEGGQAALKVHGAGVVVAISL